MCTKLSSLILTMLLVISSLAQADLVAHWPLDDGSGAVAVDVTGNGHDGDLIDGPEWAEGLYGGALLFGGSPAKVDVPYSAALNPEVFTVSVWANPDPSGSGHRSPITSRDDGPTAGYIIYIEPGNNWEFWIGNGTNWTPARGSAATLGEWTHVAGTYQDSQLKMYINGELDSEETGTISPNTQRPLRIGAGRTDGPGDYYWVGLVDDVAVFDTALSQAEIQSVMSGVGAKELAADPSPVDAIDDVLRDSVLSWTPGAFAAEHNLYMGSSFEDVNGATEPIASGLTVSSFDPGRLDFGQDYFWRVDEVNGTPDKTVFKGKIWSFQVEPYSIQIPGSTLAVTASSVSNEFSTAEKTIDGSGFGADGTHAIGPETMWFTAPVDLDPWIQYDFDDIKQLDVMKIWNSNSSAEMAIGWGVKDVQIEYTVDGENWDVLEGDIQFSRATGLPTYDQYDVIDFGGAAAKAVRLNIESNWGGILMSYGLSEVQFFMIPAQARTPDPVDGAVGVVPSAVATWRPGREAAQHTIYLSTDANAVADGSAASVTSSTNSLDLNSLDLHLGIAYSWRVDEVNEAEATPVWVGPVWSLTTADSIVVDDFESYNNASPDRPFQTWLDGFGYSADDFFPADYGGNGTGAGIGHDIWSLSSPYYNGDIMETSNTLPGSGQSMPFYYTNSGGTASETQRKFSVPKDWTVGGAITLSIPFSGQAGNTGTLYAKINGVKVVYPRDPANLAVSGWLAFNIDLTSMNVQSVTELAIGVDGSGASGMILIDDITLHATAGNVLAPEDPGTEGLVAAYTFEGNANDVSGNGNNGTVNGGAAFVAGRDGSALDCDGADDYVSTDKTASQLGIGGNGPRTVSSWVFTRSFNNGGIYDVGARTTGQDFSLRTLATDNQWRIQYWGGDFDFTLDTMGKWVQFTHVHDGVNTKIYANGMLIVDWAITLNTLDTNPFQIGLYGWPDAYFDGLIDEVRVYNRALSAEEALFLAGISDPIDRPF